MDFPEEMKQERRWCAWFYHDDPQHPDDTHKRKKVPHDLNSFMCRGMASSIGPSTWGSYQQALNTYTFAKDNPQRAKVMNYGGPGFMAGGGWCFLDLDNIPNDIDDYSPDQDSLINQLLDLLGDTYCEVSQSGLGLHFIFKVDDTTEQFSTKRHDRELYTNGRLVALTGKALDDDLPLKISTISQSMWQQLHQLLFGEYAPPGQTGNSDFSNTELSHGVLSDTGVAVIDYIMKSTDAKRFNWWLTADLPVESTNVTGKQFPDENGQLINYDPSAQDMACCNMLAYWVRRVTGDYDSRLIDEVFKQTNLYRPKWNRMDGGGTYGQRTIQQAIDHKRQQLERYMRGY